MSLDYVKHEISNTLNASFRNTNGNMINELHRDIDVRLNSVNVIVGKQGSGKTVVALQEIIKLSQIVKNNESFHLLVYVTKNGDENDRSFQSLKHLISIPYVTVSESRIEDYIKTLISAKNLYYTIKREKLMDKIDDDQQKDMFDVLHINDYDNEFLHTLVLFDDISNSKLFNNESSYFSQLIRRCRHINMSFFMLIQGFKGLKPHVKNEITTLFIFPSFNRQQVNYIYSQSASNLSLHEFQQLYSQLCHTKNNNQQSHPYIVVQVTEGGDTIIHND